MTGEPYEVEAHRVRVICHVLVDRLPNAALPELVESLGDMFRFYRDRLAHTAALAEPPRQVRARVAASYDRPTFQIEEE